MVNDSGRVIIGKDCQGQIPFLCNLLSSSNHFLVAPVDTIEKAHRQHNRPVRNQLVI